jgi:pyruvate,orthophosphate dikinase
LRGGIVGAFFNPYTEKGVCGVSPFESVDWPEVGRPMNNAIKADRSTRLDIKLGGGGEHEGDPCSTHFFHAVNLKGASCSSIPIPVARLEVERAAVLKEASKMR